MNKKAIALTLMLSGLSHTTYPANLCITSMDMKKQLSLAYTPFDQSAQGWRQFARSGCYLETGRFIDRYIEIHQTTLADWERINLRWHAGQLYAFANDYRLAIARFRSAINPRESGHSPILWNDYVYATIAFLNNDRKQLEKHRDAIAKGPVFQGKKMNLDVVNHLLSYIGQPYSVAYRAQDK